jgi:hypothetical protein
MGNKILKRIAFIKEYFKHMEDERTIVFVIDEMGIGKQALTDLLLIII